MNDSKYLFKYVLSFEKRVQRVVGSMIIKCLYRYKTQEHCAGECFFILLFRSDQPFLSYP